MRFVIILQNRKFIKIQKYKIVTFAKCTKCQNR